MTDLFPVIDDPILINKKLMTEPILAGILNKDLGLHQRGKLYSDHYIVEMEFRGENRYVMLLGFYKRKQPSLTKEMELYRRQIGEKLLLEPFTCILLKDTRKNDNILDMSILFDVDVIQYENRDRRVILCDYYRERPRSWIKPEIKEQIWR